MPQASVKQAAAQAVQDASQERTHGSMPEYQGDVSYWGKQAMSDQYFEEGSIASSQNQQSLSSGLSPRDAHPRARSWDEDEGFRVCIIPSLCLLRTFGASLSSL